MEYTSAQWRRDNIREVYSDWKKYFAWTPVTTITGKRVWLKKIYTRTAYRRLLDGAPLGCPTTQFATFMEILKREDTV